MSNPLRSKHGCWTCRLRKKKCDERQPGCAVCELLCITCYGFGDKPEWMDGGEKERVVANGIKEIVKHTSRRKVSSQATKQVAPVINIAPKPANTSVEIDLTASESIKLTAIKDQTGHSTVSLACLSFEGLLELLITNRIPLPRIMARICPPSLCFLSLRKSQFF